MKYALIISIFLSFSCISQNQFSLYGLSIGDELIATEDIEFQYQMNENLLVVPKIDNRLLLTYRNDFLQTIDWKEMSDSEYFKLKEDLDEIFDLKKKHTENKEKCKFFTFLNEEYVIRLTYCGSRSTMNNFHMDRLTK